MVMLYDGDCAVCNRAVKFVAQREKNIKFAALKGETVRPNVASDDASDVMLGRMAGKNVDSVVVVERGRVYVKSAALVEIGKRMGGGWRAAARVAQIVPRPLLDAAYDKFAQIRYRVFGAAKACDRPSVELTSRILD
jgi:predicted DCC family thiol-disulfide oxidoreductase YuxK